MKNFKVSIITVSFNSYRTIAGAINSVLSQSYSNIEYIVIDGDSSDGTKEIIGAYGTRISKFVSASDKGIYDAINKGIKIATGDIIGLLHSDDFFFDDFVIEKVVNAFTEEETGALIGDVVFVDTLDTSRTIRYFSSKNFNTSKFRFGYMPPHPSFYVRRELYEKLGYYKTDYKIAADFELLLRFLLIRRIRYRYLEMPFVSMRSGGVSNKSICSNITLNKEIARACKENGIYTNYLLIYSKYLTKVFEFFGKKVTH
jgi:glycosyltransferase involved in cell wall biosynthesis